METVRNPYYGGNDYIVVHGNASTPKMPSNKVGTIKIVNNVYYE